MTYEQAQRIIRFAQLADPTGVRGGAAAGSTYAEEARQRALVAEACYVLGPRSFSFAPHEVEKIEEG